MCCFVKEFNIYSKYAQFKNKQTISWLFVMDFWSIVYFLIFHHFQV